LLEDYGKAKRDWLKNRIPKHDGYRLGESATETGRVGNLFYALDTRLAAPDRSGSGGDRQENHTGQRRQYVSSLPADPEPPALATRAHWRIENPLHHYLTRHFKRMPVPLPVATRCRIPRLSVKPTLPWYEAAESKKSVKKRLNLLTQSNEYFKKLLFRSDLSWITGQTSAMP
jgi:hypothetical protein